MCMARFDRTVVSEVDGHDNVVPALTEPAVPIVGHDIYLVASPLEIAVMCEITKPIRGGTPRDCEVVCPWCALVDVVDSSGSVSLFEVETSSGD